MSEKSIYCQQCGRPYCDLSCINPRLTHTVPPAAPPETPEPLKQVRCSNTDDGSCDIEESGEAQHCQGVCFFMSDKNVEFVRAKRKAALAAPTPQEARDTPWTVEANEYGYRVLSADRRIILMTTDNLLACRVKNAVNNEAERQTWIDANRRGDYANDQLRASLAAVTAERDEARQVAREMDGCIHCAARDCGEHARKIDSWLLAPAPTART